MWDGTTFLEGEILVGFLPVLESKSDADIVDKKHFALLGSVDKILKYQRNGGNFSFFTHFPNIQEYRKVVKELGVNGAAVLLNSVNNLVLKDNFKTTVDFYEQAINSDVFTQAFMRKSESFFAFHNADSLIKGIEFENYSAISNLFCLKFKLNGFDNVHEIDFCFDSEAIVPSRINILIGKNGLGKSQSLNKLCRALLKRKEPKTTEIYVSNGELSRPMINRLIALVSPGEANSTFPGEYASRQKMFYRKIDLNSTPGSSNYKSIGNLLAQLVRSNSYIREQYRIDIFIETLSKALDISSLYLKVDNNYHMPLEKLKFIDGFTEQDLKIAALIQQSKQPVICVNDEYYPLSSGQLTFFQFALQCCLYIENGTLIVLDEPETHMHPNFVGEFVELLDYLLEHTGSFSVIATHSPYFVREVGRKQVHVFSGGRNGGIAISNPRLRTFGADVESISQFIFDEDVDNRLVDKIYTRVKDLPFKQVQKKLEAELSMSAMLNLKSRMVN